MGGTITVAAHCVADEVKAIKVSETQVKRGLIVSIT
jgi:hypothetical protein